MIIKSLYVKDFYILKNFEIRFDNNISILIGENGSGKSTIIELIADIFGHLHKYFVLNDRTAEFVDEYRILFETNVDDNLYEVELHSHFVNQISNTFKPQIWINGQNYSITQIEDVFGGFYKFLPSRIAINYSGVTDRLKLLSEHFERKYTQAIIKDENQYSLTPLILPTSRPFYYIKPEYISIITLSLLLSKKEEKIDFLKQYFDFNLDSCEINITFKKPSWAKSKATNKWWGISGGIALQFFRSLDLHADSEKFSEDGESVTYSFYGIPSLYDVFKTLEAVNEDAIFIILDTLLYDDLLNDIVILWDDVTSGEQIGLDRLSEGQKELIQTIGLFTLWDGHNTLFLFDEPDVYLHPKWQRKFIPFLQREISSDSSIIISTHSPSIVSDIKKEQLYLLRNGRVITKQFEHYGKNVDQILIDFFDIDNTRNIHVSTLIKEIRDKIASGDYNSTEYQKMFTKLQALLGNDDKEVLALKLDEIKLRHAENK